MKLTYEFIKNVRLLAKYRGYTHINDTYGVTTLAEIARKRYKEETGYELIDSFHLREEILKLMLERQDKRYEEKVKVRQIHYSENKKSICGAEHSRKVYTDLKLTSSIEEVTCKRCNHSLELRKEKP